MRRILSWATCLLLISPMGTVAAEQSCDTTCDSRCSSRAAGVRDCGGCRKGLYFGVEATYLAPIYDESKATFTLTDPVTPASISVQTDFDSAEELTGAPRLVFGYVGKRGFGIQGRYWELSSFSSRSDLPEPIIGNQIQVLGGEDRFNAYTIDVELTNECCYRGCNLLGTFGVRHAHIDHGRVEQVVGASNLDVFSLGAQTGESFDGTGLTFSLSGLKTINPCRGLALYTALRGSTLWGPARTTAITTSSFSGPFGVGGSTNGAIDSNDETMFIGEVGAGLQWSRCVRSFSGRMFARGGVEYQYWGTSDGFALAQSSSGSLGFSDGTVRALGGKHSTNLIGFALMAGYNW